MPESTVVIALAGNPNCGKTSLFNYITGSRQRVGNYPGVTVEKKEGTVKVDGTGVTFVDLPGTYSLHPFSPDEMVARSEILSVDITAIIVVIDSTRPERSLYFASQIIETGKPVVLALNMFDELEKNGNLIDSNHLSEILGVPCVPTVGNRGRGVSELVSTALKAANGGVHAIGNAPVYRHELEHAIDAVRDLVSGETPYNERWTAVNLLLYGTSALPDNNGFTLKEELYGEIDHVRQHLEKLEGAPVRDIVTAGRYGYAHGALADCIKVRPVKELSISDRIDSILTHKILGLPIFLLVLWVMFQTTFTVGDIPTQWIGTLFTWIGRSVAAVLPDGQFESLVVNGIIAGVGGVLVFLPNILLLFLFITIFEDTGYMARAAFIMDKVMHWFGLHGKSCVPMLIGFGCTVPAIMATRIIENRRDRMLTMFILPFMSCGARLPVYILLAGAFFSPGMAGNVIFSLYLFGIILSMVIARIVTIVSKTTIPFVLELPPYRIPTLRSVLLHMWERTAMYIRKAGTIILGLSIVVWFAMSYPRIDTNTDQVTAPITHQESIKHTYAGRFGSLIEPALKPLGLDWRMGVALTAGFAAKEVIVSSMATIYSIDENTEGNQSTTLVQALRNDPSLNRIKVYGLLLFILVYVPCMAVLSVLRREAGGIGWVVLMVVYTITLAWLISFTFIKIASLVT